MSTRGGSILGARPESASRARNGGRHHLGIGEIISEWWAASSRNRGRLPPGISNRAALALEGGTAAIALDVHLEDGSVMNEAIDRLRQYRRLAWRHVGNETVPLILERNKPPCRQTLRVGAPRSDRRIPAAQPARDIVRRTDPTRCCPRDARSAKSGSPDDVRK
jgi:hypothetical protein